MWIVFLSLPPWQALPVFQGWRPFRIPDYLISFISFHRLNPWSPLSKCLLVKSTGETLNWSTALLSPQFYTQAAFMFPSPKISSHRSTFQVWAGAPGPTVLWTMTPVVPLTNSAGSLCKIRGQPGQPLGKDGNLCSPLLYSVENGRILLL